jgi:phosphatidate cytidylyltransferase
MFQNIPPNVVYTVVGLYGVLVFATLFVHAMAAAKPQRNLKELKQRVYSWWIIIIIFTSSICVNRPTMLLFVAFVCFWSLKEYLSMVPTRRADRRILLWAYLAIPFQFYWIHVSWYAMFLIWIPVYMFLFLPLRMVTIGETKGFLSAAGTIHWGLMTTVFCISHLAYLFCLPAALNPLGGGAGLVLFLVILTQLNDVAQYVWGKTTGRHKIIPKVSPNKTWEGFLGGVVTTMALSAVLAPVLTPLSFKMALFAGFVIPTMGFIGDVVISAIKRDIGVKDTGQLLPGHGGMLDRVDSLTYTSPIFFHWFSYFYGA